MNDRSSVEDIIFTLELLVEAEVGESIRIKDNGPIILIWQGKEGG